MSDKDIGRAEMQSIALARIGRMMEELLVKSGIEMNDEVKGKMEYGIELLKAVRQNISAIPCMEESDAGKG